MSGFATLPYHDHSSGNCKAPVYPKVYPLVIFRPCVIWNCGMQQWILQKKMLFFPSASEQRILLIVEICNHIFFTSSHLHIFTFSSHLFIFIFSHLLIFASSSHPLVFTSSHLHIFTSSRLHIFFYSHLHIFLSSHRHIFASSSHPLVFTSSHLHIFSSSHLHIFTFSSHLSSSHLLHTFSSSDLLIFIFTSSHLALLPSRPLALLPCCPLGLLPSCPLSSYLFLSWGAGRCQRGATKCNLFTRNEIRSSKTEPVNCDLTSSVATLSHEMRFDWQKNEVKLRLSSVGRNLFARNEVRSSKTEVRLRSLAVWRHLLCVKAFCV